MEKESSRKRPREDETPSQRLKREKAAERQRRKRERDRANSGLGPPPMPFPPPPQDTQQQQHYHHPPQDQYMPSPPPPNHDESSLSPDEQARRERVRAAARERQRKHRQLVKQRKMRELGLDMGNEVMPGIDDVHYRVASDGTYQQVLPHDLQQQQQVQYQQQQQGEPSAFPGQPGANHAQTFATTLLISFACTPELKKNMLSILNITNEELASVEPFLAEAWDRWDQARRLRYDHPDGFPPGAHPLPPHGAPLSVPGPHNPNAHVTNPHTNPYPPPPPPGSYPAPPPGPGTPTGANGGAGGPPSDNFRDRFQRVIAVPAPFHPAFANGDAPQGQNGEGEGAGTPEGDAIDPHLGAGAKEGAKEGEA
ncbi:hypothetical protein DFH06DRAFT_1310748 [Mycena polygramma]|nr:hypothetical protein DFH06DRAFT_1310748 [Mycena polygramma]